MTNTDNTLWNADWNDNEALKKVAVAVPENYRMNDPDNPRMWIQPTVDEILPLVVASRKELESRGVEWRPQKPVERVERPTETPEQHLDAVLSKAAARMVGAKGRRG